MGKLLYNFAVGSGGTTAGFFSLEFVPFDQCVLSAVESGSDSGSSSTSTEI